jgi:sugar lactone lactonase YvrE
MRQKTILNSLILLLTAALLFSCEESTGPDNGGDPKPPGYQEEIPWPSLADSPWPIHHADPQNTGRSDLTGPLQGIIGWEYKADEAIHSGITLGSDGIIYFTTSEENGGLTAITEDGQVKFTRRAPTYENYVTPLITNKDEIVFTNLNDSVSSINFNNSRNWSYKFEKEVLLRMKSPAIDKSGNLYFLDYNDKTLFSISPQGELNWELSHENFDSIIPSLAISTDGKTLYIPTRDVSCIAIDIESRSVKWTYGKDYTNAIMVDDEDNIYFQTFYGLTSLNKNGNLRWKYSFENMSEFGDTNPTIDKLGNIYFATDTLYSLNYNGELRWKKSLQGKTADAPLVCDNEGNVFVGASREGTKISAFNENGMLIWDVEISDGIYFYGSPAIGEDSKLYVPIYNNKILCIK